MYVASIVVIVTSNVLYHICQKSTPAKVNPFTALFVTYVTAAIITLLAIPLYRENGHFIESFKGLNWTSFVLGGCVVGLEFGWILAYRAGWNVSVGSLVANISLATLLIPVGIFIFKEGFELKKVIGSLICIAGLIIMNK
jgi:EamA-like transporter family.